MEEYPQFLNLNPMNKKWLANHKVSEEKKLELRLGPPGEFHGCNKNSSTQGTKRAFQHTAETRMKDVSENQCQRLHSKVSFFQNIPISKKLAGGGADQDFPQPCCSKMADVQFPDSKACSSGLATADHADSPPNNTSNKRIAYSPVVGWPPIRSSRKNLASSSSPKPASESSNEKENTRGKPEKNSKNNQMFVKINMEGIPIGRKVNLCAYNSYEELSLAIDELFSGLLAAQRDSSATQKINKIEELAQTDDAGSLAASGEYTLIYEDDERDRMLVGDVPWHMFVSTVKRLHVLKSSELSTLKIGNNDKDKTPLNPAVQI